MKREIWRELVDNMRETGHGLLEVQQIASKIDTSPEAIFNSLKELEKEGYIRSGDMGTFSHPNSIVEIVPHKKRAMEKDLGDFHYKWNYR